MVSHALSMGRLLSQLVEHPGHAEKKMQLSPAQTNMSAGPPAPIESGVSLDTGQMHEQHR